LDYHGDKTLPFIFENEVINPIWCMAFDGNDIYAGTGSNGILLKSTNRNFWSNIYVVDDIHIKALMVQNKQLFIGTAPNCKIYIMDLEDNTTTLSQTLNGTASSFCYFNNKMYLAKSSPSAVYIYDTITLQWDLVYEPYKDIVSNMFVLNDKMYLFMDGENFVCFDGSSWIMLETGLDNVNSFRKVSKEPFSNHTGSFLNRNNIVETSGMDDEEIFSVFPIRPPFGICSAASDGNSLILGTSHYGKIYSYSKDNLTEIFDTESTNTVHALLNIDLGTNLAAIDNKLYLIYSGILPNTTTTTTTTTTVTESTTSTTSTTLTSIITVISPMGEETFIAGDTVNIIWNSDLGVSEAVKIELYKGNEVSLVINPKTSNEGSYQWVVPDYTTLGNDYRIAITWLTASSSPQNTDFSNGYFTIANTIPTTTTTTTTSVFDSEIPNIENNYAIPILDLLNDEYIVCMYNLNDGVIFGTFNGRILYANKAVINAYLTGNRKVYAEVKNGFGIISDTAEVPVFYALYNKIVEISEDKEVVKYKFVKDASAIMTDRLIGTFLSPIINVKENLGFWKQLIWQETKPTNTEILICIRSANTLDELKLLPWDYCFISRDSDHLYGSTGYIIRDLTNIDLKGKYLQFKVEMTTDTKNISPHLINLSITYSTSFAVYFFTTKFALENDSNAKSGLLIANMTQPVNTEVKFGIVNTNSVDWNDYTVIEPDKFFSLQNFDNIKVGIKMISYDYNIPSVAEFALMSGGDKDNLLNS
jgi:hypothetical protein